MLGANKHYENISLVGFFEGFWVDNHYGNTPIYGLVMDRDHGRRFDEIKQHSIRIIGKS